MRLNHTRDALVTAFPFTQVGWRIIDLTVKSIPVIATRAVQINVVGFCLRRTAGFPNGVIVEEAIATIIQAFNV